MFLDSHSSHQFFLIIISLEAVVHFPHPEQLRSSGLHITFPPLNLQEFVASFWRILRLHFGTETEREKNGEGEGEGEETKNMQVRG